MKRQKKCFVLLLMVFILTKVDAQQNRIYDWPLFVYNFGSLSKLSIKDQIDTLKSYGYAGMTVSLETIDKLESFNEYYRLAQKAEDFKIFTAFYRFNYDNHGVFNDQWKQVIDRLSETNTDLWLIFGRKLDVLTDEIVENKIAEVADYAFSKNVKVTLYPHSNSRIETAEQALYFVKKLDRTNLDLAVHMCHELRAGNGNRIEHVIENVKDYIGYVTISGADSVLNTTNLSELEYSTLKPLYRGNYDLSRLFRKLRSINYKGSIGFINHRIDESVGSYLPKSIAIYNEWLDDINFKTNKEPFDAPDQCVWHSASKSWFVSNLGGGISLEKDGYGWISRLDESGNVIEPVWIGLKERMNAPSGMIATEKYLFVCDRDGVYKIDIENHHIEKFYPISQAEFINDIAIAKNGDLFISDFYGNRIFRISAKSEKVEIWLEGDMLRAPDGIYIDNDKLVIVSWGVLCEPGTFNTSRLGDVLVIDLKTKNIKVLADNVGNLEGLTKVGKYYYISDWKKGNLLRVDSKNGKKSIVLTGLKNPTDLGFSEERQQIAIPQHGTNQVLFYNVNE